MMMYKSPSTTYFPEDDLSWVNVTGRRVDTTTVPTEQEMDEMMATYLQHNARFDIVFDPMDRRYTIRLVSKTTGNTLIGWKLDYTNVHGRK